MSEINHDYQQPILDTATGLTCTQSESTRTPIEHSREEGKVSEPITNEVCTQEHPCGKRQYWGVCTHEDQGNQSRSCIETCKTPEGRGWECYPSCKCQCHTTKVVPTTPTSISPVRDEVEEAREWYSNLALYELGLSAEDINIFKIQKWMPTLLARHAAHIRTQEREGLKSVVVTTGHGEHDEMRCAVCGASYDDWTRFKHEPNCKFAAAIREG